MAAIDFSDYSLPVLQESIEICRAFGANLNLINIINQRDVDAIRYAEQLNTNITVKVFLQRATQERREKIASLLQQEKWDPTDARVVIKAGVPFEQIIRAVKEQDVDLLVMGPKGRGNLASVFFGTTAEKMFRHCPVSLLSVRDNGDNDRNRMKS